MYQMQSTSGKYEPTNLGFSDYFALNSVATTTSDQDMTLFDLLPLMCQMPITLTVFYYTQ